MFHMSDDDQTPSEEHKAMASVISETSPFLPRASNTQKPDVASVGADHLDDGKQHIVPSSVVTSHLEPVEEGSETTSDLHNSVLDQLRNLRAGTSTSHPQVARIDI